MSNPLIPINSAGAGEIAELYGIRRQLAEKIAAWLSWITARLPDPDEQQALMQALDDAYPPWWVRVMSGVIVLGTGGWITLTALGGTFGRLQELFR